MDHIEFFEALNIMEREKGVPADYLAEKISSAIVVAIKKDHGGRDVVFCDIDCNSKTFNAYVRKSVVAEVEDPFAELLIEDALQIDKNAVVGGYVEIPLDTMQVGRIAAQTAKHVIRQGIRDAERDRTRLEFKNKNQELVSAKILRVDPETLNAVVEIANSEATLPRSEQLPDEELFEGDTIKIFIVDVLDSDKGPRVRISRIHSGFVRRLFEQEVPEIFDGTIEIKAITREAGSRTKMAVWSKDPNVDAVGSCIGQRGARVARILEEIGNEKIDIVKYSEEPEEFIKEALSPAKVVKVEVDPSGAKNCKVTVPDGQLSLAIGNKGQNVRLAARLTGWKIDIRPESGFYGE